MKVGSIEIRIDYDEERRIIGFSATDTASTTVSAKIETGSEQRLKDFCNGQWKSHPEQEKELKKFYNYYSKKKWYGDKMDIPTLWKKWIERVS